MSTTARPMTCSGSKSLTYRARSAAEAGVPGPPVTSADMTASQSKWSRAQTAAIAADSSSGSLVGALVVEVVAEFEVLLLGPLHGAGELLVLVGQRAALRRRHRRGQRQPEFRVVGRQRVRVAAAERDEHLARPPRPGDVRAELGDGGAQVRGGQRALARRRRAWTAARPAPRRRRPPSPPGRPRPARRAAPSSAPGRPAADWSSTAPAASRTPGGRPRRRWRAGPGRSRPPRAAPPGGRPAWRASPPAAGCGRRAPPRRAAR